jgi:hypothetical protein
VKYEVAHIPNPFKTNIRKHKLSPSSVLSTSILCLDQIFRNSDRDYHFLQIPNPNIEILNKY